MAAIHIAGRDVQLERVKISGFDIGVQIESGGSLTASSMSFDRVRVPILGESGSEARISGTRIKNDPKTARGKSQTGFRRDDHPRIPSRCGVCETIFPSNNYRISSSWFSSFDNEDVCPVCGDEHAKLAVGIFDLSRSVIQVLASPSATREMILALQDTAAELLEGKISPDVAIARYNDSNRDIGSLAGKAYAISKPALEYLSFVCTIVALIYAISGDVALNDKIDEILKSNAYLKRAVEDIQEKSVSADRVEDAVFKQLEMLRFVIEKDAVYPPPPPLLDDVDLQ